MTPLLVLLFGVQPTTAVGTDLLYAAATKSVGTAVHGAARTVDWRIVSRLSTGSIPAAVATLLVLSRLSKAIGPANHFITLTLGVTLLATAFSLLFRRSILAYFARGQARASEAATRRMTIGLGAILGVLVSVSSVGAGAIGVTVLLVLYPSLPANRLVGSDIAHALPLTLIAGAGHWLIGSVNLPLLLTLLVGSVPGVIVGSLLASRVPDQVLRPIVAGVLLLVGGKLTF
jgi:uncharacterized membrane protein YfcA